MKEVKIKLTAEEWVSLINKEGEELPCCCANISALRDDIISLLREDGMLSNWTAEGLMKTYCWAVGSHSELEESLTLQKLMKQVADFMEKPIPQPTDEHEKMILEYHTRDSLSAGVCEMLPLLKELVEVDQLRKKLLRERIELARKVSKEEDR